jgi:hypothetical protein
VQVREEEDRVIGLAPLSIGVKHWNLINDDLPG